MTEQERERASEREREREDEHRKRYDRGRDVPLSAQRDYALARLDEKEIKGRMIEGFDAFLDLGYEVALIGVAVRGAVEYRLELASDGSGDTPVSRLSEIAEQYRLDLVVDKDMGLVAYPRW